MTDELPGPAGVSEREGPGFDGKGVALVFGIAGLLYLASMSPVVFWGDSAEFALKAAELELSPVARGYPLYRAVTYLLGLMFSDPAFGANFASALFAAVTAGLLYECGRVLGGSGACGVAAAATTAVAHTFWSYAGVAEVYSLHTTFLAAGFLCALHVPFRERRAATALGVVLGFALLHHRLVFFAIPGLGMWAVLGARPGRRLRVAARVVVGFLVGAVPFVVLCATNSRSAPVGVGNEVLWWMRDVFLGGAHNTQFMVGDGAKSAAQSAVYMARWIAFNLPGPALLLGAVGMWASPRLAGRPTAVALALLSGMHLVFPFRYDWTGDQYAFLVPLYPVASLAVALGVAWTTLRWGRRAALVAAVSVVVAPVLLYVGLARVDSLGKRVNRGLTDEARGRFFLPVRLGDRWPQSWCRETLEGVDPDGVLHCDWGDGQVHLYLQQVGGLRPDVTVRVWYNDELRLVDPVGRPQNVSIPPLMEGTPPAVEPYLDRLRPLRPGLLRIAPPDGNR